MFDYLKQFTDCTAVTSQHLPGSIACRFLLIYLILLYSKRLRGVGLAAGGFSVCYM